MERSGPRARPAFNQAADAMEAWRRQQIAALSESQRLLYEQARGRAEERQKALAKRLADRVRADVEERMRAKLLDKQRLVLELRAPSTRMSDMLARRAIAEYFQSGDSAHDHRKFQQHVREIALAATAEIEREHALEAEQAKSRELDKLDRLLQRFQRGRQSQRQNRLGFELAAARGRAKADFETSAGNDDSLRDLTRDDHQHRRRRRRRS